MLFLNSGNKTPLPYDDHMFKDACCGIAQMCSLYYTRRPSHDCTGYQPPVRSEPVALVSCLENIDPAVEVIQSLVKDYM